MTRRQSSRQAEDLELYEQPATIGFINESLRSQQIPAEPQKSDEKISVFWRVFGGTILSITALIAIQAFQAQSSNIHELRNDQNRLREMTADFIKKDELTSRTASLWSRMQELQSLSANVTVVSTKLAAAEAQAAVAEKERKDLAATVAQLVSMREKINQIDDMKKHTEQDHKELLALIAALNVVKDKDCTMDKKMMEAEVERKELVKELQKLRERIAKLEGQSQPAPSTGGKTDNRKD